VSGASRAPSVQEFAASGSPLLTEFIPASRMVLPASEPMTTAEAPALRSIPNVPWLALGDPYRSVMASLVTFWAGRRPVLQALQQVEVQPLEAATRPEQNAWLAKTIQELGRAAAVEFVTPCLSPEGKDNRPKPSFTDYRIEIDQGRPVLLVLHKPTTEGTARAPAQPLVCVGTGYLVNRSGSFLRVQVPLPGPRPPGGGSGQAYREAFLNWEVFAPSLDLLLVKPERGR